MDQPPDASNPLHITLPSTTAEIADRTARLSMRHAIVQAVIQGVEYLRARMGTITPPSQGAVLMVIAEQLAAQVVRLQHALHQLGLRTSVPLAYMTTGDLTLPLAQVQAINMVMQTPTAGGGTPLLPTWCVTVWIDPSDDPTGQISTAALMAAHNATGPLIERLQAGDTSALDGMGRLMLDGATAVLKAKGFSVAAFIGAQSGPPQAPPAESPQPVPTGKAPGTLN